MRKPLSCKMTEALGVSTVGVLTLMLVPYAAAQRTFPTPIDGPVVAAYDPQGAIVEALCGQTGNETCGQQFSVGGGGAYVVQLELGLAYSSATLSTCSFTMLITDSVVHNPTSGALSFGTIFLQRNESATLDFSVHQ